MVLVLFYYPRARGPVGISRPVYSICASGTAWSHQYDCHAWRLAHPGKPCYELLGFSFNSIKPQGHLKTKMSMSVPVHSQE